MMRFSIEKEKCGMRAVSDKAVVTVGVHAVVVTGAGCDGANCDFDDNVGNRVAVTPAGTIGTRP